MKILPFKYEINSQKIFKNEKIIDISDYSCIGVIGKIGSGKSTLIKLLVDYELQNVGAFDSYDFSAYLSQDLSRLFIGNTLETIINLYENKDRIGEYGLKSSNDEIVRILHAKTPRRKEEGIRK